jgi:DNA-binding CsgD family transcriptional regulator/pimeloyl-ACP methyl ester carboxylesterase
MEQEIHFLDSELGPFALASIGTGPALVMPCWWIGSVDVQWEIPGFRAFIEALARRHTVVRYDHPRDHSPPAELAQEELLLGRVVRHLGGPVSLFGASSSGCVSIAFAADHPELVDRLVLYGAYASGARITTPEVQESLLGLVLAHWGLGSRALADVFMPDASAVEREQFAVFQRRVATPADAARRLLGVYSLDASDYLSRVRTPTIVLHRTGDKAIPFALGRELATGIAGARFVPLAGRDHFPWVGDVDAVLRPVLAFLGGSEDVAEPVDGSPLSERERQVLVLVARGLSNSEIAELLVLSPHTVHRHVANVRRKLRQPSRAAAVAEAARLGLLA